MFRRIALEPWQKNLAASVLIQVLSLLAFQAGAVLVPYFIQDLGVTDLKAAAAWTGAWQSVGAAVFAIFTPIWGAISDRYGRRPNLLRAAAATAIMLAINGLVRAPWQLLVVRALQGMFTGTPAAATALVAVGTPKKHLAFALGLLQTSFFIGMSIGPMVGGYLGDAFGFRTTYYIAAAIVAVSFIVALKFTVEPEESAATRERAQKENALVAFRDLLRIPALMGLIVLTVIINLTGSILSPAMPIFIQEIIPPDRSPASIAGNVFGASALTAAISAVIAGKISDRIGHRKTLLLSTVGITLLYVPQGLAPTATALGVFAALQGLFRGGLGPSMNALVVESSPRDKTGSALGLSSSAASVGFALGPMLGAAILAGTSTRAVFFVAAVLFAVVTLGVGILTRRMEPQFDTASPGE